MDCAGRFGLSRERFWGIQLCKRLFFGVWTHFSPDLCGKNWRIDQIPHSDEVVSSGRKGEHPSDLVHAAMSGLTQHSHCLQPAEYFLNPFPLDLTYFVSGVPRGAPIVGRPSMALPPRRLSFCATWGVTFRPLTSRTNSLAS